MLTPADSAETEIKCGKGPLQMGPTASRSCTCDQKVDDWQRTEHPEILVKYCLRCTSNSTKTRFHTIEDRPQTIPTQPGMRSQPKKGPNSCTFRADRTWFATECSSSADGESE
ncbi:hypothetical protein GWK47_048313 [Chionoecetes opilio]|uniref:Uncharacterized protein n=1 Tax=Chionoecetes opilio TaxID=41210 RepID=A0A8J4YAE3_CHIOP|nr:hypothetical protein GWK47_048313 [Chionoecetes opilio]